MGVEMGRGRTMVLAITGGEIKLKCQSTSTHTQSECPCDLTLLYSLVRECNSIEETNSRKMTTDGRKGKQERVQSAVLRRMAATG